MSEVPSRKLTVNLWQAKRVLTALHRLSRLPDPSSAPGVPGTPIELPVSRGELQSPTHLTSKPSIQHPNPNPETRYTKSETRNPDPSSAPAAPGTPIELPVSRGEVDTRNPIPEIRNPIPET